MDIWAEIATIATTLIAGGGIGHKLTDWMRERDAKKLETDVSSETDARDFLRKHMAELRDELAALRGRNDLMEQQAYRAALRSARNQAQADMRIAALEKERDGLREGYERIKRELAEANVREQALRVELDALKLNVDSHQQNGGPS